MEKLIHLVIDGTIVAGNALTSLLDNYAEKLKQRRKAKNLTLAQLAQASGLTVSAVARIERKERVPSIDTVLKIEKALEGGDDNIG